jgi:fucose 4-O-acetylase-like acetyltransferase
MNVNNDRIAWVDTLRFLGIWAIYIGHFGDKAGRAYPFVFSYHVPLFFFAAGFFSIRYIKDPSLTFIKKKTLQLMLPYVVFSILAMIVFTLYYDWDILQAKDAMIGFLLGIRGQVIAGSLWFLPCLYIIIISDYFVMRLFKSQTASLGVSFIAFLVSQTLLHNNPASDPSWFMGLDSALFYYIYYSLGSAAFPLIKGNAATTSQRILTGGLSIVAIAVTVLTYFQAPYWLFGKIMAFFPILKIFQWPIVFYNLCLALVIIYCNVIVAKFFAHISFLGELGRETLVFCGTEDIAKITITQLLAMINLKVRLISPFVTIAFSLITLLISKFTLIGFLNAYFPWAIGKTNPDQLNEIKNGQTHA